MIKEGFIKEYLSNINFKSNNWSVDKIKDDLKKLIGEYPAIDVVYKKDVIVNEDTQESREVHDVDKISIVFTNEKDNFQKIEILV